MSREDWFRDLEMFSYHKLTNWGLVSRVQNLRTPMFIREVRGIALAMLEACDKRLAELGEKP